MRTSPIGKVHIVAGKHDPETPARAVRLVLDDREDYPSGWAAITAVSHTVGHDRGDPPQLDPRWSPGTAALGPHRRAAQHRPARGLPAARLSALEGDRPH